LRASVAKNLKIQLHSTLASSYKRWVVHELPLAMYQKDESKDNPWNALLIELDEDFFKLLYILWNHHPQ
jgi:hypothetical protein